MARTTSTTRRATLALGVVAALALLLQIGVVFVHYGNDQDYLDRAKTDQEVEAIAAAISFDRDGAATVRLPDKIAHRYKRYPNSYAFVVTDNTGRLLAERNKPLFPAQLDPQSHRADYSMTCLQHIGERLCASSRRIELKDRTIWVSVAVAGDPANIVRGVFVQEIVEDVGVPIIPILLIMLIVNVVAVRRALRPLDKAAGEARLLDPAVEGQRLSEDGLPTEVLALVHSINGLLSRAEQLLAAQREFTANAAHELRTPIAVLMLRLDELKGEVADRMRNDLKAMSRQVDQLLELAKVDAIIVGPNSRVDLAAVAHETVEALAILAVDRGCELAYENENAATIRGSKDAIQLALRNLIDNAIRHSPTGGAVRVVAGPGARLQVIDQGGGIPIQQRERIFRRFWRGSQNEGAAGLGLAIVRHVAEAHGARVEIADAPGGGAHISLVFDPDLSPRRPLSS